MFNWCQLNTILIPWSQVARRRSLVSSIKICSSGSIENLEVSIKGAVIRSSGGEHIVVGGMSTSSFRISVV